MIFKIFIACLHFNENITYETVMKKIKKFRQKFIVIVCVRIRRKVAREKVKLNIINFKCFFFLFIYLF